MCVYLRFLTHPCSMEITWNCEIQLDTTAFFLDIFVDKKSNERKKIKPFVKAFIVPCDFFNLSQFL